MFMCVRVLVVNLALILALAQYESAVALLEQLELSPETEAMWNTLRQVP